MLVIVRNKISRKVKQSNEDTGYENCVLCRKTTDIRVTDNINLRRNYVEGAGQLCDGCGANYK